MGIFRTAVKTVKYGVFISAAAVAGLWLYETKFSPAPDISALEQNQKFYPFPESLEVVLENRDGIVVPYLTDRDRGISEPITGDFQLGSAGYRINGLIDEGAGGLILKSRELVDYLTNKYKNAP